MCVRRPNSSSICSPRFVSFYGFLLISRVLIFGVGVCLGDFSYDEIGASDDITRVYELRTLDPQRHGHRPDREPSTSWLVSTMHPFII